MAEQQRMQWDRLLSPARLGDSGFQATRSRSVFAQDHDRIVFSAPFRRLANKTQVQPLYENDHVHHRLIHSIEVSSVGRSLAMRVGQWLAETGAIPEDWISDLANIVQAACVAHDIGNPPFGHSGEKAMGDWFAAFFDGESPLAAALPAAQRRQFTAFEGNAQGFRIITRLEMYRGQGGMRLTKATLGAFAKYPVTAADRETLLDTGLTGGLDGGLDTALAATASLKKFGIFSPELDLFAEVADSLGLPQTRQGTARVWARHPLVFLMEAADDITYNIVDIEDAFTTGELPAETVRSLLGDLAGHPNLATTGLTAAEEVSWLRARSIGAGIDACTEAFITHYDALMEGRFTGDLVGASRLAAQFDAIREVARSRIFTAPRKTELEISGRRIIGNVMSGILPVYEELAAANWQAEALSTHAQQLVRALSLDLRDASDAAGALHALADFTSGMTDRYALRISRMLSGT